MSPPKHGKLPKTAQPTPSVRRAGSLLPHAWQWTCPPAHAWRWRFLPGTDGRTNAYILIPISVPPTIVSFIFRIVRFLYSFFLNFSLRSSNLWGPHYNRITPFRRTYLAMCKASNDSLILVIEISGNCGTQLANLFEEYTYKLHKQELQVHQSFCLELFIGIFLCQETYLFAAAKRYCAPSSSSTSIFKIDCRKFSIPGRLQNSSSTAQLEPQRKPLIVYTRYTGKLAYSQNKK